MIKKLVFSLLVTLVVSGLWIMLKTEVASKADAEIFVQETIKSEKESIVRILKDLRKCESDGRDEAINKVDLDGTPSWGRYQFKPSTLYLFATKYKILTDIEPQEIHNILMDGELQERVLIEMIKEFGHSEKFWMSQFPGCSKRYEFWAYR